LELSDNFRENKTAFLLATVIWSDVKAVVMELGADFSGKCIHYFYILCYQCCFPLFGVFCFQNSVFEIKLYDEGAKKYLNDLCILTFSVVAENCFLR